MRQEEEALTAEEREKKGKRPVVVQNLFFFHRISVCSTSVFVSSSVKALFFYLPNRVSHRLMFVRTFFFFFPVPLVLSAKVNADKRD